MFLNLQMPVSRKNGAIEQVGCNYDISQLTKTSALPGYSQTITFQPLGGVVQQTKYLMIRHAPFEIEIELSVADVLDPIVSYFVLETDLDAIKYKAKLVRRLLGNLKNAWLMRVR